MKARTLIACSLIFLSEALWHLPNGQAAFPQAPLTGEAMRRVKEERDVSVSARLKGEDYSFLAVMAVRATEERVKKELLNFSFYRTSIPYISRVEEDPKHSTEGKPSVWLEGGIFGWNLKSRLDLRPTAQGISYEIVEGSLQGLQGEVKAEPFNTPRGKTVLLFFNGSLRGKNWPPAWVMERGAEIVFGFTAKRMRSFLEEPTKNEPKLDQNIPKARKRI